MLLSQTEYEYVTFDRRNNIFLLQNEKYNAPLLNSKHSVVWLLKFYQQRDCTIGAQSEFGGWGWLIVPTVVLQSQRVIQAGLC